MTTTAFEGLILALVFAAVLQVGCEIRRASLRSRGLDWWGRPLPERKDPPPLDWRLRPRR